MASDKSAFPGIERAAILLLALGEDEAATVLKHLEPREVDALSAQMTRLANVPAERVGTVLESFRERVESTSPIPADSAEYVKNVLTNLVGKQRAELMVERTLDGDSVGIEALRWMEPRVIMQIIGDEHPQVMASVLSQIDGRIAAKVLAMLPEEMGGDVLMRIAALEELPHAALAELDQIVGKRAAAGAQSTARKVGGPRTVADIINAMDRESSDKALGQLEVHDVELHRKVREMLFVFEDIGELDDRAIQAILRGVASDVLAVALRGAEPAISEKFFRNMSKRAGEIMKEDMEARGPIKLSEVEAAQSEVIAVALKLAEEGTIVLTNSSDEYV
ncbi:MAG: flagellar motor switch protein FliG [Steroidobacteraceae bacterium]|jgi:flagellar motor switch protein FliG|nr:flagellar motor switch protein FliG [Steroidobacteraceae bacterium]